MGRLLTINEVSEILGVKISWIRSAVKKKQIKCIKLNRLIRFRQEDIYALMKN